MPSRIELMSLVDFTNPNPTIDAEAFPNTPTEGFWSASPFVGARASAWGINFGFNVSFVFQDRATAVYRVRCVREATATPPAVTFQAMSNLVQSSGTKLSWQRSPDTGTYTWSEAATYCATLDLGGRTWRVPSVKEVQTLVDESRSDPAIDQSAFPNTVSDYYWTSSSLANFDDKAWAVDFKLGFDIFLDVATKLHVRCVS